MKLDDGWETDAKCDTGGENIYNIIRYLRTGIQKTFQIHPMYLLSLIQHTESLHMHMQWHGTCEVLSSSTKAS